MSEMRYHCGMVFEVIGASAYRGKAGQLLATDFEYHTTELMIDGQHLTFHNREVRPIPHTGKCPSPEICGTPLPSDAAMRSEGK